MQDLTETQRSSFNAEVSSKNTKYHNKVRLEKEIQKQQGNTEQENTQQEGG